MAERQWKRLQAAGRDDTELRAYADGGHYAYGAPLPNHSLAYKQLGILDGSVEANAAALQDAFPKVVSFLRAIRTRRPTRSRCECADATSRSEAMAILLEIPKRQC